MSIDADVRAGLIDFETARRKREELQVESKFYGALDGAMKFIKGDAVAGMVIIAVNIAGGFAAGILIGGLDVRTTLARFTLLTIGDGLVSQIPALLNALSAGMVVTRVSRSEESSLSHDLIAQIGQERAAQSLIGGLSLLLAALPGMPAFPFVAAGFVLGGLALVHRPAAKPAPAVLPFRPKLPPVVRIVLPQAVFAEIAGSAGAASFTEGIRTEFYARRGLLIAAPEICPRGEADMCIELRGNREAICPISDGTAQARAASVQRTTLETLDRFAPELVDDILTRRMLDAFDRDFPELVSAVVPAVVSVTQLTELLRNLAAEGVSIRNFDVVLQSVSEAGPRAASERALLETVRIALRRSISHAARGESGAINAYLLERSTDLVFSRAEREQKLVDPQIALMLAGEVRRSIPAGSVLLTSRSARRLVRDLLAMHGALVPVLAHEELVESVEVSVKGRVGIPEARCDEVLMEALAA
jgi:type III secretion protein V